MLPGCAVGAGFIAGIAAPAIAAAQQSDALASLGQIEQHRLALVVQYLRADRHMDDQIIAARTGAVLAHAAATARGFEMLAIAKVDQRVQPGHRLEDDVAALAAIAAIRAAIFDIHFAAKAYRPRAAGAGAEVNFGLIEKMHRCFRG